MPKTAYSLSANTVTRPSGKMQSTRSAGTFPGPIWSIGSSATKIRPSGAAQTTDGWWLAGFSRSTSNFQSARDGLGCGGLGSSFFAAGLSSFFPASDDADFDSDGLPPAAFAATGVAGFGSE